MAEVWDVEGAQGGGAAADKSGTALAALNTLRLPRGGKTRVWGRGEGQGRAVGDIRCCNGSFGHLDVASRRQTRTWRRGEGQGCTVGNIRQC